MEKLKEHLNTIVGQLTPESTLEDVYEQLSLLTDIEKAEQDEESKRVFTTSEVKHQLNEWLK